MTKFRAASTRQSGSRISRKRCPVNKMNADPIRSENPMKAKPCITWYLGPSRNLQSQKTLLGCIEEDYCNWIRILQNCFGSIPQLFHTIAPLQPQKFKRLVGKLSIVLQILYLCIKIDMFEPILMKFDRNVTIFKKVCTNLHQFLRIFNFWEFSIFGRIE